jgi:hypothetical protein
MDTQWAFRQAYYEARKIKESQDAYCAGARKGHWNKLGEFPESLQWEALVDVLRGRVKVNNHCYEAVDFDGMIRVRTSQILVSQIIHSYLQLTNEFKFSIAAFHHAHEAYLVPDLLKKMYKAPPAVALFATNARYKREAYRGSEFAPRVLADHGIQVVMKVRLLLPPMGPLPLRFPTVRSPGSGLSPPPLRGAASTLLRTASGSRPCLCHYYLRRGCRLWTSPRLREAWI